MSGPLDGKRWVFDQNIVIGRDTASVQAALPVDHAVSRVHARIDIQADCLMVADLNSSNGTILGGQPISAATQLEIGEPFVVGRTMMRILRTQAAPGDVEKAP